MEPGRGPTLAAGAAPRPAGPREAVPGEPSPNPPPPRQRGLTARLERVRRWARANPLLLVRIAVGLAIPAGAYLYVRDLYPGRSDALSVQIVCLVAAVVWAGVVALPRLAPWTWARPPYRLRAPHPAWWLVGLALGLRLLAHQQLPFANQTGFEETQTGGIAYRIAESAVLPIEFRFTNILATAGYLFEGEPLERLRLPFRLAGLLTVLLVVLTLRHLRVGWAPTLAVAFVMATLRWLVLAGGSADELFAGLTFQLALTYFVVRASAATRYAALWAALAGLFAGILIYEYTSYRIAIVFGLGWLLWRILRPGLGSRRESALATGVYLGVAAILALPSLLNVQADPTTSVFLEAFFRHGGERTGSVATNTQQNLGAYLQGLFGLVMPYASRFYALAAEPVIPLMTGVLFALGLLAGLILPSRPVGRWLALCFVLLVLSASLTANNPNIGRMTPALPFLLLLSGLFLDDALRGLGAMLPNRAVDLTLNVRPAETSADGNGAKPFAEAAVSEQIHFLRLTRPRMAAILNAGVCTALVIPMVALNLQAIDRLARDPSARQEYANDAYTVCREAGYATDRPRLVYILVVGRPGECNVNDNGWLYPRGAEIISTQALPQRSAIRPGSVVVLGSVSIPLSPPLLEQLYQLARDTGSLQTLHVSRNLNGLLTAASICVQCSTP